MSDEFVDARVGGGGGNIDNPPDDDGDGGGGSSSGGSSGGIGTVLSTFADNPRGFILGAVLTTVLEAVTGVVTTAIGQLVLLVGGSQPTRFDAPGETLGLADLPVAIVSTMTSAGGFGGRALIQGIDAFNGTLFDAAATAGPFAPLIVITIASVEAILVVLLLRRLVYVAADLLQLGGLTE